MTFIRWQLEVFPYLAVLAAVIGSIARFKMRAFSVSSLSSQFLESKRLFWGSVPFHFGIIVVLLGHLVAFLWPEFIFLVAGEPSRLVALETLSLVFGFATLFGLVVLIIRRISDGRVRAVTTAVDFSILALLILQCLSGIGVAASYRWGAAWYAGSIAPYLWSLVKFQPDSSYVAALPGLVRFHILGGFLILGLLPFSRLIHALSVPIQYLWRAPQVVVWNRKS
jgi:nitrate reductase gamma subunit